MLGMFFANVFDAEVINDEAETDGAPIVLSETRADFALPISLGVEALFEEVLGNSSCVR